MSLNEKINGKTIIASLGIVGILGFGGKMALDDYKVEQERINPNHIKLHGFNKLTEQGYHLDKVDMNSKQRAYITDISEVEGIKNNNFTLEMNGNTAKYSGPVSIIVDFNHPTTYAVSTKPSDSYATKNATLYFKK